MRTLIRDFIQEEDGFLGGLLAGAAKLFGGSSLLKGAASAVGGKLLDKAFDKKAEGRAQAYEDPAAIRARYEAAGFNPLLAFTGNGASTVMPSVGQSSAASTMINAALDRDQSAKIANAELEQENRRLEMMAEELAFKDPGQRGYANRSGIGRATGGAPAGSNPKATNAQGFDQSPDLPFGQSAEADTVYEIESDAYLAGIRGNIQEWADTLWNRNAGSVRMPGGSTLNLRTDAPAFGFSLIPGGMLDRARRRTQENQPKVNTRLSPSERWSRFHSN